MDFDCNTARGDSSSSVNRSCIVTEGTLIQAKPFTHHGKTKRWNSLSTLNNQKCSYESLSDPKKNVETNDGETASKCDSWCFTDFPAALICEVLGHLDPKELGLVSCISTLLHTLATDHQGWKKFYCERWGLPTTPVTLNGPLVPGGSPDWKSWKTLFVEREFRSKSFLGRFSVDVLCGHCEDVRTVFLLASVNLIFTGGNDSVIRMWDMEEGILIDKSRSLCCTIQAIVADTRLLVTAGTNAFIHCWRAVEGNSYPFRISGNGTDQNSEFRLWGHEGPVTCLALDSLRIFSGSWDTTVRVWDRSEMKCVQKFMHADWVWSVAPHGNTVSSTAGSDAYVWDITSGELKNVISSAHVGNAYSLARAHLAYMLGQFACSMFLRSLMMKILSQLLLGFHIPALFIP